MSDHHIRLMQGSDYPYDAPDSWRDEDGDPIPAVDRAHAAARGIIADLRDRRGIKYEFDDIDQDTRAEMVASHAAIIRTAMDMPEPAAAKVKTLRDEFAMAAAPALIARHRADVAWSDVAPRAYEIADAMMKAREG